MKKNSSEKIPSFQFYPYDWRNDIELQSCSLGGRGLWIELMCLMHNQKAYGFVLINDRKLNENDFNKESKEGQLFTKKVSRLIHVSVKSFRFHFKELLENGVIKTDDNGDYYSKRMLLDQRLREERKKSGELGGNPKLGVNYNKPGFVYLMTDNKGLTKVGISANPNKRLYKIRQKLGENIELKDKYWVDNMGLIENYLHNKLNEYRENGEWFRLPESMVHLEVLLKGKVKEKPTSSITSSSSPSFSNVKDKEKVKKEIGYSPQFLIAWDFYPRQEAQKAGYAAWCARIKKKVSTDELIKGTKGYTEHCKQKKKDPEYIMLASTFYGSKERWKDFLNVKKPETTREECERRSKEIKERMAKNG